MKKKLLVFGIIFLFIGVAFSPIINADVTKQEELVKITTKIWGFNGWEYTVYLSKEEAKEVDRLFENIRRRLNEYTSRAEAEEIFNEAIVELDKYGLLGELSVEKTQRLIIDRYKKTESQILNNNKIHNLIKKRITLDDDSPFANICCFLSATATENPDHWPPPSLILPLGIGTIIAALFADFIMGTGIGQLGKTIILLIAAAVIGFPFKFMNIIMFAGYNVDCQSLGLKGFVNNNEVFDYFMFFGYSGIVMNIFDKKAQFLGFSFFIA